MFLFLFSAGSPLSSAFLRRTQNTPGSNPGSRQGTPRSQAFVPSKPRLSLQNALCTPISKLVLTDDVTTRSSPRGRGTPQTNQRNSLVNVSKPSMSGTPVSARKDAPSTPKGRLVNKPRGRFIQAYEILRFYSQVKPI